MKKILIVILLAALCIVVFFIFSKKTPRATIGNHTFIVEFAKTDKEKEVGLSKYTTFPIDHAMYFPFEKAGYYEFWMKDMHFPIDILFLRDGKVVTVYSSVPVPKDNVFPTYQPTQPADAVLEISAGLSRKYLFKVGDTVEVHL